MTAPGKLFFSVILASVSLQSVYAQNFSLRERIDLNASERNATKALSNTKKRNTVIEDWENADRTFRENVNQAIKMIFPMVMKSFEEGNMNLSTSCIRNAMRLISGLKASKVWAFSIIDASGKALDGLLTGSLASLGEYDQCINTEAINDRKGRNHGSLFFRGKYCALDIRPPLPEKKPFYRIDEVIEELKNFSETGTVVAEIAKSAHFFYFLSMRIGVCVPSGCSKEDISSIAKRAMGRSRWTVDVKRCELKEEVKITPVMAYCFGIFGFFGLLLIIGTIVDLIYSNEKKLRGTAIRVLTSFSFVSNFRKFTDTSISSEALGCLTGVRVLSITWIILGHTYMTVNYQLLRGLQRIITYKEDFLFQVVINASVAVDSFFFMSGLLMCFVTMRVMKEVKQKFSVGVYILHRVWRMLPMYALVMAFLFLTPLLGAGPIWHDTVDPVLDNCYRNWWTNLLFVNNYVDAENICLVHTWYVACDMQLYLFSLIILLPLLRWPKVGIGLAVLCAIISMIVTSLITYFNNFPPTMLFAHVDPQQRAQFLPKTYYVPYPHASAYFIGILVGYFLAVKPNIFRFSRMAQILGWCVAIVCGMSAVYGVWEWNVGRVPNAWESVIYSGCHRAAWALALAWVVICCATGHGGIAHYFLTWKAWVPISRLTYAVYLVHPIVQMLMLGNARMKLQPTHDFSVWVFFGHLMVSYGTALAFSMLIEAPTLALEKIFLRKGKSLDHSISRKSLMNEEPVSQNCQSKESKDNTKATHVSNGIQNTEVCRL